MNSKIKKYIVVLLSLVMVPVFSLPSFSYYMSDKDLYGDPPKTYEDGYEEGYADGYEDNGGEVIYRTRIVNSKNDAADKGSVLSDVILTVLLVLGICAVFFMFLL